MNLAELPDELDRAITKAEAEQADELFAEADQV